MPSSDGSSLIFLTAARQRRTNLSERQIAENTYDVLTNNLTLSTNDPKGRKVVAVSLCSANYRATPVGPAKNVQPKEVIMHLEPLCGEKKIPFAHVKNKLELGRAAGIDVSTAAIAITEVGDAKKDIDEDQWITWDMV